MCGCYCVLIFSDKGCGYFGLNVFFLEVEFGLEFECSEVSCFSVLSRIIPFISCRRFVHFWVALTVTDWKSVQSQEMIKTLFLI